MKIGLFIKYEVVDSSFEEKVSNVIRSFGHEIDNLNPEYVFVFGGDGTFLKSVQKYIEHISSIKFVCFNKGKVGFFSSFVEEDLKDVLSKLNSLELKVNSYRLLESKIGEETLYSVNETRIENPFHTLLAEVYIDGIYLETFRGNGLVVSTSLGSTAYNKSLSGACVSKEIEAIQLNEIAPINNCLYTSLKNPLVLPSNSHIVFKGDFSNIVIGYDHLVKSDFKGKEIEFFLSDKVINVVNKSDDNYIKKLKETFIDRR